MVFLPAHHAQAGAHRLRGGPAAGLEAAIVARDRGHEVILCEKTGTLGGLLRYARKVPFKRETQQYVWII